MATKPRRERLGLLAMAVALSACTTVSPPVAKVETLDADPTARSRSVVVLADFYMQDPDLADRLREDFQRECQLRGYEVQATEDKAELILVPSLSVSAGSHSVGSSQTSPSLRRKRLFETSPDSNRSRSLLAGVSSPQKASALLVFSVSAYRRQDWFDPQFIDAPMPKLWCIAASAPQREGQESKQVAELLAAVARGLEQIARLSAGRTDH